MRNELTPTRRWRVTLRELFLITAILALSLGWWSDRRHLNMEIQQTRNMKQDEFLQALGISSDTIVVLKSENWSVNPPLPPFSLGKPSSGIPQKKLGAGMAETPTPGQLDGSE